MSFVRLLILLAGTMLALASGAARAQEGGARAAGVGGEPLSVCLLRATPGLDARRLFARPGTFDCGTPQTRFGPGDYWVLSAPLPPVRGHAPTVRFASLWQDAVTLHVLYADGAIRSIGMTTADAGRHLLLGATFGMAPPHRAAPPVRLLWHVRGAANLRGVLLGAVLSDHGATAERDVLLSALYGGFAGLGLALIVGNLSLWWALRQRFQIAYSAMVTLLVCYAATSSGALGQLLPALDNNDRMRLNALLLAASAAAALLFARCFFEPAVFRGWRRRASDVVMAALVGAATLFAVAAPWHVALLDRIITGAYVLLLLLVPAVLWRAWQVRSNYLWIFTLAWGLPIVLGGLRIANTVGLVPWSFWLDQSTLLAMAAEALISSVALAYRIHLLAHERDQAREQEIAARLLADTDSLTGLLNRRAFLHRAIGRAGPQTLFVLDIDHFKQVNETVGHDGGDEVLRIVARALAVAAPDALVARFGGEEFVILADAGTGPLAAHLLDALRDAPLPFDLPVTGSVGSCTGPLGDQADWKLLYRRADEALFAAKAAGRDRARDATPVTLAA